jgi:hypothetical protein
MVKGRGVVRLFVVMIVASAMMVSHAARSAAQQPHSVQLTHSVVLGDLNRDCVPDTALIDQLGSGHTRVKALVWGVVEDSLDVCDAIKRTSNPFPGHDTLYFTYRHYSRPRSALIATKDPVDTAHIEVRLTVFGHMNASADTILYPQAFVFDNHRNIDIYDTLVVDSWNDLDNVDGVTKYVRTVDTNDVAAFVHRQFDVVRVNTSQLLRQTISTEHAGPASAETGLVDSEKKAQITNSRVVVTDYGIEVVMPYTVGEHRMQIYSLLGDLLYEDTSFTNLTLRDVTVSLRPGTYAVVIHVRNAPSSVVIFQKAG